MSDLAGRLNITLRRYGGRLGVTIASTRPLAAPSVFAGRSAWETARRLPALFSICATAQASACAQTLEQALGLATDPETVSLRQALVETETVKEHLWRLLLEWPRLLGEAPSTAAMRQVLAAWGGLRSALADPQGPLVPGGGASGTSLLPAAVARLARVAETEVFGLPTRDWLAGTASAEAFLAWARDGRTGAARSVQAVARAGEAGLGACGIPALAHHDGSALAERLAGPAAVAFVARPDWDGVPRETGPFTRTRHLEPVAALVRAHGNGLLARQAAVLAEVAVLLSRLWVDTGAGLERASADLGAPVDCVPGVGIAQVEAARGLLVHRVELEPEGTGGGPPQDRLVRAYQILAPTEWNFHPQGVVARGLASLSPGVDDARLLRQAGLFVTLVDPCVDYELSLV